MKKLRRSTKVFSILIIILLVFSSTYYTIGIDNIHTNSKADSVTQTEGNDNNKLNLFTFNKKLTTQETTDKTKLPLNYLTQQKININGEVLKEKSFNKGDSIFIEIPEVGEYEAIINKVAVDLNGVLNLRGLILGSDYSYIIISINQDKLIASINLVEENKFYTITYEKNNNSYYLNKIDTSVFNNYEECDELIPPASKKNEKFSPMTTSNINNLDEEVTIDVMFVYTEEAKNWADTNVGSIELDISNKLEGSQLVLDNSNVGINLRLVHAAQVNYISNDSSITDLYRLQDSKDGYMDEVHDLRDEYGADLVVFLGGGWYDAAGRAFLGFASGNMEYGFSVCNYSSGSSTIIHEIGHNMGCHHSRNQISNPASSDGGAFKYSTGWRWNGNDDNSYASIMTYSEGSTGVPIFSNPNVIWKGQPTGSYTGEFSPADNARSLREMKHIVSNYRLSKAVGNKVVNIEDNNLLLAIREQLQKPVGDITKQDMAKITNLTLWNKSITSISGLEHAINLSVLYLDNNKIKDLSPISNLTQLSYLSFSDNDINDITPLSNLTNLIYLDLDGNKIKEINPLSNLTKLIYLILPNNEISDIKPLSNLTNIDDIDLSGNKIKDLGPLSKLTQLRDISLYNNEISDIEPLSNLTNTIELNLDYNEIKNIDYLSNLVNLNILYLDNNKIKDLSPISNLTQLSYLSFSDNDINDINPLRKLTNLIYLDLDGNKIKEINPLSNLTKLTYLILPNNEISDIKPLSNLTNIDDLDLGGNKIKDLGPLSKLTQLRYISLYNNEISEIKPLSNLTNIIELYLGYNEIKNIDYLSNLVNLNLIDLSSNKIKDISGLIKYLGNRKTTDKTRIYLDWNYLDIENENSQNMIHINQLLKNSDIELHYKPQNYVWVWVYLEDDQVYLNKNNSYKLKTSIKPDDAYNKNLIWYSSDDNIVTVDENGLIKGINPGKAKITVELEDGGYYDTCEVTVIEPNYDVNDDGLVDKNDILTLSSYYRLVSSDQVYNKSFDLNLDGKIDILDIVLLSKEIK